MPHIVSTYKGSILSRQPDVHTIIPALFSNPTVVWSGRKEIPTRDKDFLDSDWIIKNNKRLVVISHGLEGSSDSPYIRSLATVLSNDGWDVCAWNFRGCSGRLNNAPYYYHSGLSDDLRVLIEWIETNTDYEEIGLVGFSVGGNITLKFLGEEGTAVSSRIKGAVCWSVPVHLASSSAELSRLSRRIYLRHFIKSLKLKIKLKAEQFPELIDLEGLDRITNFYVFDRRYTAPLHGFKDELEYWEKSSSINFLGGIRVPGLLVNALDDPFLAAESYPLELAAENRYFFLETPLKGGHVAFLDRFMLPGSWMNARTLEFLNSYSPRR